MPPTEGDIQQTMRELFYYLYSKQSCEILTTFQLVNRGNDLRPIKNVTILMNGNYHRND